MYDSVRIALLIALIAPCAFAETLTRVYVDTHGSVHVVHAAGRDEKVRKEKQQVGAEQLRLSEDKQTAGWAADYPNCCTSYPIPLLLVIYRDGKIIQRLNRGGLMIYDWRFWDRGKQVAFCTGTVHFNPAGHCELHDVRSGKLLATIDGDLSSESPMWARGLRN
jgi:hypothetical protein